MPSVMCQIFPSFWCRLEFRSSRVVNILSRSSIECIPLCAEKIAACSVLNMDDHESLSVIRETKGKYAVTHVSLKNIHTKTWNARGKGWNSGVDVLISSPNSEHCLCL